jgi:hypothetical protein
MAFRSVAEQVEKNRKMIERISHYAQRDLDVMQEKVVTSGLLLAAVSSILIKAKLTTPDELDDIASKINDVYQEGV